MAAGRISEDLAWPGAPHAAATPLGFAIVGMGRAGKIHLACLQEAGGGEATVCCSALLYT